MPDIEGDGYRTETSSELIDGYCCIVDDLDPWIDTSCRTLDPTDRRTLSSYVSEIDSDSSSVFRYLGDVLDTVIDRSEIVTEIEFETTRELMPVGTRIDEGWRRE